MSNVMITEKDFVKGTDSLSAYEVKNCLSMARILANNIESYHKLLPKICGYKLNDKKEKRCTRDNPENKENDNDNNLVENYISCLMGELSERAVFNWLTEKGLKVEFSSNKYDIGPDPGYDILIHTDEKNYKCSVKSTFIIPDKKALEDKPIKAKETEEIDLHFDVFFTPSENEKYNGLPTEKNMQIIGWLNKDELSNLKQFVFETVNKKTGRKSTKKMESE